MSSAAPQFDRRQAKIHDQLIRLIGPGAAAFFRDTCRLFQEPLPLESGGNMAAHLLRELKSAIKDVLLPAEKPKGANTDEKNIRAITAAFGLEGNNQVINAWKELDLATLAHRDHLNPPRSLDDVRDAWQAFQNLLATLLDAFESGYASVFQRVDAIVGKDRPTDSDLSFLLGRVPNNPYVWGYIFEHIRGRNWLQLLLSSSLFDSPPAFGYWPQAPFLSRMAKDFPDDVAPVLERVVTKWNFYTHHHALQAIEFLTPAQAAPILVNSATAVRTATGHDTYTALEIAKKAAAIADEVFETTLSIFETLLSLEPVKQAPRSGYFGARDLVTPIEYYSYAHIVAEPLHDIISIDSDAVLRMLIRILRTGLASIFSKSQPNDFSKSWMPSIESHEQNAHQYDPVTRLFEGIRDAAEKTIESNPSALRSVVESLVAENWQSLNRLALYLLGRYGEPSDEFVHTVVLDESTFFSYDLRREYGQLFRRIYPAMRDDRQRLLRTWIAQGPRNFWDGATAEDRELSKRSWAHVRLSWIRDYLPEADLGRLKALDQEFGLADETADFTGYISGPFQGPTSPKNTDELASMSVADLSHWLHEWEPSPGGRLLLRGFAPTREGLAREIEPLVKARASEFAAAAEAFIAVDVTYARAVVSGLAAAAKENAAFDWHPVLRFCSWAVAQPRSIPGRDPNRFDSDADWGGTRAAIARLLSAAFRAKGDARLPHDLREQAWAILVPITDDIDPTPEREKDDRDPFSVAINSTRGAAIEAVVQYAQWVRGGFRKPESSPSFADMPEVEAVLNHHLDPAEDPSPAIRAMYGQWLFFLNVLFPGWVASHIAEIFPASLPRLSNAVLQSYLAWGQYMSPDFNRLLAPEFARAIESIQAPEDDERDKVVNFVVHLGQRAIAMYLHGEFELTGDSLVARFFSRANEASRAQVLSLIPQGIMQEEGSEQTKMRDRAMSLWTWRLATSTDTDLRAFSRWFEADLFDAAWRLEQLRTVLARVGKVDMDYMIVEKLGKLCAAFPHETFECVKAIVNSEIEPSRVYALTYRGDLQRVVHAAMTSGDVTLRKNSTAFANAMVAHGILEFRKVLEPDYSPPAAEE